MFDYLSLDCMIFGKHPFMRLMNIVMTILVALAANKLLYTVLYIVQPCVLMIKPCSSRKSCCIHRRNSQQNIQTIFLKLTKMLDFKCIFMLSVLFQVCLFFLCVLFVLCLSYLQHRKIHPNGYNSIPVSQISLFTLKDNHFCFKVVDRCLLVLYN